MARLSLRFSFPPPKWLHLLDVFVSVPTESLERDELQTAADFCSGCFLCVSEGLGVSGHCRGL